MKYQGGSGGTCIRNERQMRLVERALRERWHISKAMRGSLIDRVGEILDACRLRAPGGDSGGQGDSIGQQAQPGKRDGACKALNYLDLEGRVREIEEMNEQRKSDQTW